MYDPFQTHSVLGAYPGLTSPFQSPYTSLNPQQLQQLQQVQQLLQLQQLQQQQQQLAQLVAARGIAPQLLSGSPWTTGLTHPLLQSPLIGSGLDHQLNPIFASNPFGGQTYPFSPYIGQTIPQQLATGSSPYGQINPMLAPQSWVGQPGLQPNHGIHPALVSQLLGRGFPGVGFPGAF